MNFDLSEDQRTIKSTAREFLAARYPLAEVRRLALDDERGWTDRQWQEIAALGWPGLPVQEEAGGMGLGAVELAVVAEELGYALAPSPLQSTWMAALQAPSEELASGDARGTVGLWREDDGAWVAPDAAGASVLVADGRAYPLEGDGGEPVESLDPTRRLSRVRVSGEGSQVERDGRHWIEVLVAAELTGVAQRCMEMAVAYAKERRQFGRPIGSYQAVSHRCAQMLLEVEGARGLVYNAAWALDHAPEEAPVAAAMAKAYASDAGVRVASSAIQVHGGIGFTWESDLHFFLKRAEADALLFGGAGEMRRRVVESLLGEPTGAGPPVTGQPTGARPAGGRPVADAS